MMTLFLHELKQNRRATLIWTISLLAGSGLYVALFPAIAKDTAAVAKMINNYPLAMRQALGIFADSYATLKGFYAMILGFITLAGAVQAMNLGTALTSQEERGKTAEFLLAKPIDRKTILTAKLMAALTDIAFTNLFFIAGTRLFIAAATSLSFDTKLFLLMSLTLLFVQLFFLALGFIISVSAKRIKSVLTVSLTTVFAFYIVGMLDAILGLKNVRVITPFKFFDLIYIMKNSSYEWTYVTLEAALVVAAVAAGYLVYLRRDIQSI
jgi:ABC-2 type transport system permease protein